MNKLILIFFAAVMLFAISGMAWDNASIHKQINRHAFDVFNVRHHVMIDEFGNRTNKFYHAKLDLDILYKGEAIFSGGKFFKDLKKGTDEKTMPEWLEHGGFSADEPWIYMGNRHFYDPINTDTPWLRDGSTLAYLPSFVFEEVINPNIDALSWAMKNPRNTYNYENAQVWYRHSMERPSLTTEQRKELLGMSFRALGETMHLMGDMVLPSHVRDDAHLTYVNDDPIEQAMKGSYMEENTSDGVPMWKGPIPTGIDYKNKKADEAFHNLALFANKNFFSLDTIYSEPGNGILMTVTPGNGEIYPSPQLKDLDYRDSIYYKKFERINPDTGQIATAVDVPLARWEGYIFGLWEKVKQRSAYTVPGTFVRQQAQVLMPLAVQAGSEYIYEFFPTMRLQMKVKAYSAPNNYAITGVLKHFNENDINWKDQAPILYSGPGDVVVKSGGQTTRYTSRFYKGEMFVLPEIDPNTGKPISKDDDKNLKMEPVVLPLYPGDNVWLEVNAGGRKFICDQVNIINVVPSKDLAKPAEKINFKADMTKAMELFKSIFSVTPSANQPSTTPVVKPKPVPDTKLSWKIDLKDKAYSSVPVTGKATDNSTVIDKTLNNEGEYAAIIDLTPDGDNEQQVGVGATWVGVAQSSKLTTDISLNKVLSMLPLQYRPLNGSLEQWGFKGGSDSGWVKDISTGVLRKWSDYNNNKQFDEWETTSAERYRYYCGGSLEAGICKGYNEYKENGYYYQQTVINNNGAFPKPEEQLAVYEKENKREGYISENVNVGDCGVLLINEKDNSYRCFAVRGPVIFNLNFRISGPNKEYIDGLNNTPAIDKDKILEDLRYAKEYTRNLTIDHIRRAVTEFDKWYLRKMGNGPWIKGLYPRGNEWCKDFMADTDAPVGMAVTEKNVKSRNRMSPAVIEYRKTQIPVDDDNLEAYRIEMNSNVDINDNNDYLGIANASKSLIEHLIASDDADINEKKVPIKKLTNENYPGADEVYSGAVWWHDTAALTIQFRVANLVVTVSGRENNVKDDVVLARVEKLAKKFLSKINDLK